MCRLILQILAGGLLLLIVLSIIAKSFYGIFMYLLLIYILYMSWSQFNWCLTLLFFLFCVTDFIQSTIMLIGMYFCLFYRLGFNIICCSVVVIYKQVYIWYSLFFILVQLSILVIMLIDILRQWIKREC
jgi:hypothetical protein